MKNARLIIDCPEEFSQDIWQCGANGMSDTEWKEAFEYMIDNMQNLYNELCETEEYGAGTEGLYSLGDAINMLRSLEIVTI